MYIHRFWTGSAPPYDFKDPISEFHPDDEMANWTPENLPDHISRLVRATSNRVDPNDRLRHAANIVRWSMLLERGGLWLDYDYQPFAKLTGRDEPWFAGMGGNLETCAVYFPTAGHTLLAEVLGVIESSTGTNLRAPDLSGTKVIRRLYREYPDIKIESRALPFDAAGKDLGVSDPIGRHYWNTSSRRTS